MITLLLHQSKKHTTHTLGVRVICVDAAATTWTVLVPQVPGHPVHRGALSYRAAAADGSDFPGSVWRQAAD